jgi:hypothetical protein
MKGAANALVGVLLGIAGVVIWPRFVNSMKRSSAESGLNPHIFLKL